jgi:hypothetical protein
VHLPARRALIRVAKQVLHAAAVVACMLDAHGLGERRRARAGAGGALVVRVVLLLLLLHDGVLLLLHGVLLLLEVVVVLLLLLGIGRCLVRPRGRIHVFCCVSSVACRLRAQKKSAQSGAPSRCL